MVLFLPIGGWLGGKLSFRSSEFESSGCFLIRFAIGARFRSSLNHEFNVCFLTYLIHCFN